MDIHVEHEVEAAEEEAAAVAAVVVNLLLSMSVILLKPGIFFCLCCCRHIGLLLDFHLGKLQSPLQDLNLPGGVWKLYHLLRCSLMVRPKLMMQPNSSNAKKDMEGKKQDIRKWFMKQPHKSCDAESKQGDKGNETIAKATMKTETKGKGNTKEKTDKTSLVKGSPEKGISSSAKRGSLKRKVDDEIGSRAKKPHIETRNFDDKEEISQDDIANLSDDDVKMSLQNSASGRGRGRGGGGGGGRGRGGGGRGFYANFVDRQPPPNKGQKEVPVGAENCLSGLTFVITGTLDSLEREEAEDLIKSHGGRVTGSVSKKTSFLLTDIDVGGRKSQKAQELGVPFLTEDGLFEMIRKSKPTKSSSLEDSERKEQKNVQESRESADAKSLQNVKKRDNRKGSHKSMLKEDNQKANMLMWTVKYKPKTTKDIVGNQSIINQLHEWLSHWEEHHLHSGQKVSKGKRKGGDGTTNATTNAVKKAVLLSGPPGIGKTTSARLVSQQLGFETVEVNASDNRGKADSKITKGIAGSRSNSIKEMVSNESLSDFSTDGIKHNKAVLIMDEVDGMSGGDRGGVADLISSIKISKIPIICICNDRYSQKLKSLLNYCLPLNFRKPTKQQMAKRLHQIALSEGVEVDERALEELGERVNGDMRMALNQLQYMSLSFKVVKYADIKARLKDGGKDEDITPFTAADKLLGYDGGRLSMDERMNLCMSDPDLVPLLIQENYLNYKPSAANRDASGSVRMDLISHASDSIAEGDIINKQIRRYQQWQHSQMGAFASSIIPASLLHGQREALVQGERNFNRFGAWLGKNSSFGKNTRLLSDVHVHVRAANACSVTREALRLDYFSPFLLQLASPLQKLPKDEAVQAVVSFMDKYSLTQEDFDTICELSKFQGHRDSLDGVPATVKSALTKAYKQNEKCRQVRSADLVSVINVSQGQKTIPKKKRAPLTNSEDAYPLNHDEQIPAEDTEDDGGEAEEDSGDGVDKNVGSLKFSVEDNKPKGMEVHLDIKGRGDSAAKSEKRSQPKSTNISTTTGTSASSSRRGGKRKR